MKRRISPIVVRNKKGRPQWPAFHLKLLKYYFFDRSLILMFLKRTTEPWPR